MVRIRYRIEHTPGKAGGTLAEARPRWFVWRRVNAQPERAVGGLHGAHASRKEAEQTIETQKKADRSASTRLETAIDITVIT